MPATNSGALLFGDEDAEPFVPDYEYVPNSALLFRELATNSSALLFKLEPGTGTPPLVDNPATVTVELPGIGVSVHVTQLFPARVFAKLPGISVAVSAKYVSGASRPLASAAKSKWQPGVFKEASNRHGYMQALPFEQPSSAAWMPALPVLQLIATRHQQGIALREDKPTRWQDGNRLENLQSPQWQETIRTRRPAINTHWQDADKARNNIGLRWQDGIRNRTFPIGNRWQHGRPVRASHDEPTRTGLKTRSLFGVRYQEAMKPPPGIWVRTVPPIVIPPCYFPNSEILFLYPWENNGSLLFICDPKKAVGPGPGATVTVAVKRVYMTINNVLLSLLNGKVLPCQALSLSLDTDSWTWQWSGSLHADALPDIQPTSPDEPVELVTSINGQPFRLTLEGYSTQREFGKKRIQIRGRGRSAILDAPHAPILNFGNTFARTAQQLMTDALTINGVDIGWDVDFGLEDWGVPGDVWSHQGTYISALQDIAGSVGGYLQPHDTDPTLRVLLRYPTPPWEWGTVTPDYELPSSIVQVEGVEWSKKPLYDRIYVSGTKNGVLGNIKKVNTAGDILLPMATHPLITNIIAARQRGTRELSDSGTQAQVSIKIPILQETGVIKPGDFVRYNDQGEYRLGIVRSTQIEWSSPVLRQNLSIETHLDEYPA